MKLGGQLAGIEDARALAQAIVDTVREPLLVLDKDMRVVTASRSFYLTFRVNRQETQGHCFFRWATASGTSRAFGLSWKRSSLSTRF